MRALFLALPLIPTALFAETPKVAVDIAPVHSIVSAVMDGVGTPDLIVRPGASPHGYALRPSEAQALDAADVVVWVGPVLSPWMEEPIEALASDATIVTLLDVPGTETLSYREGAAFAAGHEGHDHGHSSHDHEEHDHGHKHDDHGHDHGHKHNDHGHDHGHDHSGGVDPHAWLDPHNAKHWAEAIAAQLSEIDPENAATYAENAAEFGLNVDAAEQDVIATLESVSDKPFVVFHDAYQYFEAHFGVSAVGAISAGDATSPSAASVAQVRDRVGELDAVCALTEPQFNPGIADAIGAAKLGEVDPLGATLTPGAALYPQLLRDMGQSLAECLS